MMRATAFPTSITAQMLADGTIQRAGCEASRTMRSRETRLIERAGKEEPENHQAHHRNLELTMHPLSVQIITRDSATQREVHQQYVLEGRHPRWELFKIFVHALVHVKFS
jgi:hypothetical protein